jgi:hypothetical protein
VTWHNENFSLELPGLVSSRAIRALLEVQKREKPYVLFLSETFEESEIRKFEEETRL